MPPLIDSSAIDAFHKRQGPGPTIQQFSWTDKVTDPWNQRVIQLLAQLFLKQIKECKWQELKALPASQDEDTIRSAISNKLLSRREQLKRVARMANSSRPDEVAESLAKANQAIHIRSRRNEHRRNVTLFLHYICSFC